MVDVSSPNPEADLLVLRNELEHFSPVLLKKPSLLAATKIDVLPPESRKVERIDDFEAIPISSVSGEGIDILIHTLGDIVTNSRSSDA